MPAGLTVQVVHGPGGAVWIRTQTGIAWYDGYRFQPVTRERGAPARPAPLSIGRDGTVWLSGPDGLYRGNAGGFKALPGKAPARIGDIAAMPDGTVIAYAAGRLYSWSGDFRPLEDGVLEGSWAPHVRVMRNGAAMWTSAAGLVRSAKGRVDPVLPWPGVRFHALAENESGQGLVAVVLPVERRGLWEWDSGGPRRAESEGREQVRTADIAPDGTAIVVYESGVVRLRRNGVWSDMAGTPPQLSSASLISFDAAGDLWTATASGINLLRRTDHPWRHYRQPFPDEFNTVNALAVTRDGKLWLGSPAGIGVVAEGAPMQRITEAAGVPLRVVTGLDVDKTGAVWATSGASFKGIARFDGKTWKVFGPSDGVPAANVHNVEVSADGWPLFVITGGGPGNTRASRCVLRWNGTSMERIEADPAVYSAVRDGSGALWLGGAGGIERRDSSGQSRWWRRGAELKDGLVWKILAGLDGSLWFGDRKGNVGVIWRDGRVEYFGSPGAESRDGIMDMTLDGNGGVWVSSSLGLHRLVDRNWKAIGAAEGLPSPFVWPIVARGSEVCTGALGGGAACLDLSARGKPPAVDLRISATGDTRGLATWSVASFRAESPDGMIDTRYSIDGEPWSPWSTQRSVEISRASRGQHRVRVEAWQPNGQRASAEASLAFEGRWFEQPKVQALVLGPLALVVGLLALLFRRKARHRAELAARDARFRCMIEHGLDGIVLFGANGEVKYASPSAPRIVGPLATSLWAAPVHPEDRAAVDGCFRDLAQRPGERRSGRMRMIREGGEVRWLEVELSNHLQDPALAAIVANFRDVTASVNAVAELAAAKDRSEAASRAKSDFLATMSHEIRTPMNGIMGMTSLLLESPLGGEQREYAQSIQASSTALLSILNDILDLSRIEAGKLEIRHEAFDLPALLGTCADFWRPGAADKGLNLVYVDEARSHRWVKGDAGRLRQVVLNLLNNAVKFTRQGRVTLRCFSRPAEADAIRFDIEVEDTGEGIAMDKIETIFDKFTQGDSSAARNYGGSGLGLAISRNLVRLMGGDMSVTSRPGAGSRFTFHLTLEPAPAEAPVAPVRLDAARPDGLVVLVVEDNRVNQRLVQRVIEKRGGRAVLAENGAAAVQLYQRERFDAILMDCQMPVMDGYEATRRIRELEGSGRRTAIIALTANAMRGDREKCLDAGMDAFVAKPFEAPQLIRLLELARSGGLTARERAYSTPNT